MQKNCLQCGINFETTNKDLDFYKKVSPKIGEKVFDIPPPRLCTDCRMQRKLGFRNERKLYRRKCNSCGKSIISIYSQDADFPVFCQDCWWSDRWSPLDYGMDFDFDKTFADNFANLQKAAPKINLVIGNSENSDFTNFAWQNKNSYMISASDYNEDCLYGSYIFHDKNCVDSLSLNNSELCYECINSNNLYSCQFCQNCKNLNGCILCYDCLSCSDCFGCVNLRNKKNCIFNEQFTKEDYKKELEKLLINPEQAKGKFKEFKKTQIHRFGYLQNSENCTGNNLANCKNCQNSFDSIDSEDCSNVLYGVNSKDSHDCIGGSTELCYESTATPENYHILFSALIWPKSTDLIYCLSSASSSNCFGCISAKQNKYCIFNKQYTKENYEKMVGGIIEHMQKNGEWGEFFPANLSPFAYNETVAQEYFPLNEENVLNKNWKWRDEENKLPDVKKVIPAEKLPNKIEDIPDDVLNWAIKCKKTKKPFKIQKSELEFYRKMNITLPHFHPDIRHENRIKKQNPRKLWDRNCDKCNAEIKTTFAPEREEKVYCEKCYLKEIN